ncbi:glycosyltransferase family 4 protein [Paenibacillus sp. LjRoot153]|uniref:glycosyltransferase family 4 protein n=1 Tax=Paenibacillus sp. LjRoot153 TaxID=3342270 RepID=UPI003ECFDD98
MKILHLSTSFSTQSAGYRLHQGLRSIGINSNVLVGARSVDEPTVIKPNSIERVIAYTSSEIDKLLVNIYSKRRNTPFSASVLSNNINKKIFKLNPSLIHLHWINGGFIRIEQLEKIKKPMLWTLHDSWGFTGGCHIPFDCNRYQTGCGKCPALQSNNNKDLSSWILKRKIQSWQSLNLTLVTPSHWLANAASSSLIFKDFRVEVIPNGINTDVFKPIDKKLARNILGLSENKKYILFGAVNSTSDYNKGFHLLQPALQYIKSHGHYNDLELIVFGSNEPASAPDLGLKTNYVGMLNDAISLLVLYNAADVFVAPSLQENFPNTILESLSCGTPAVAFKIGGIPDLIDHQKNGFLAKPFDSEDLANGIMWVLDDISQYKQLSIQSRKKVESNFSLDIVANKYGFLYNELISQ